MSVVVPGPGPGWRGALGQIGDRVGDAMVGFLPSSPVFTAALGLALVIMAEGARDERTQRYGLYGYLLLQAAGALGGRSWRRLADVLLSVYVFNLVLFAILNAGVLGPRLDLIGFSLFLTFVSGLVGVAAFIAGLVRSGAPPRRVTAIALGAAIISYVLIVLFGDPVAAGVLILLALFGVSVVSRRILTFLVIGVMTLAAYSLFATSAIVATIIVLVGATVAVLYRPSR